jgi:uncharacterized membrane protein YbhN (UPF0104 family)
MKLRDIIWSVIGIGVLVVACFLLYREVRNISLDEIGESLAAIPTLNWLLAAAATLVAYAALAWYDRIAISHLNRRLDWLYITLVSFVTYALAHNIGASVLSGGVVRYRAYRRKGLSGPEIGILVFFCSFTFTLGSVLAGGVVLILQPSILQRFVDVPLGVGVGIGLLLLGLVGLYVFGAWRQFPVRTWRGLHLEYPRMHIVGRQLLAGPLELAGAAAIIYFALPEAGNPGYITVLGIFLASFSLALLSHAPGGLGVLEMTFIAALPEISTVDVLAALIVFRGLYLLIPFALSLLVAGFFEYRQIAHRDPP